MYTAKTLFNNLDGIEIEKVGNVRSLLLKVKNVKLMQQSFTGNYAQSIYTYENYAQSIYTNEPFRLGRFATFLCSC